MERDQEQTYRVYGELLREYRRQCQDALEEIERALTYLKVGVGRKRGREGKGWPS